MKTMTVGKKIACLSAAQIALTVALGTAALVSVKWMNHYQDATVNDALPGIYYISRVEGVARDMRGRMLLHIASDSAEQKARFDSEISGFHNQCQTILKEYEKTILRAPDREMFTKIEPALARYYATWDSVRSLSRQHKEHEALAAFEKTVGSAYDELAKSVTDEVEQNKNYGDECTKGSLGAYSAAMWWIGGILLLALVSSAGLGLWITRGVSTTLRQSTTDLAQGAEQIASAASQVASSSQSLAQGSSEQAASLQETSASTQQITSIAQKNAGNSQSAADVMSTVDQNVKDGNRTLEEMVASMNEINASSEKISKIIKVIDEIAFQTNILALNAAVEAARAGEAGMGFAVVADEVRNLAQRSAQAAKDTAALIEESVTKSSEGGAKLRKVSDVIRSITESSAKVKVIVDELNADSQEQSRGIQQIANAISQMDHVTQGTAASAEQSASASQQLSAQAEAMKNIVSQLRTMVGGNSDMSRRPAPPSPEPDAKPTNRSFLNALKSAPSRRSVKEPPPAAVTAGERDSFPLEDDFTESL